MAIELCDQKGFVVPPGRPSGTSVNGSTQQLTNATKDTNTTATVSAGTDYLCIALKTGNFYLGLADVTTAANVMWVVPLNTPGCVINIPCSFSAAKGEDVTLHYATDTNNGIAYLIELDE
jgi:hypothetical protein